jgi:hypothetical protein
VFFADVRQGERALRALLCQVPPAPQQVCLSLHSDSQGRVETPIHRGGLRQYSVAWECLPAKKD